MNAKIKINKIERERAEWLWGYLIFRLHPWREWSNQFIVEIVNDATVYSNVDWTCKRLYVYVLCVASTNKRRLAILTKKTGPEKSARNKWTTTVRRRSYAAGDEIEICVRISHCLLSGKGPHRRSISPDSRFNLSSAKSPAWPPHSTTQNARNSMLALNWRKLMTFYSLCLCGLVWRCERDTVAAIVYTITRDQMLVSRSQNILNNDDRLSPIHRRRRIFHLFIVDKKPCSWFGPFSQQERWSTLGARAFAASGTRWYFQIDIVQLSFFLPVWLLLLLLLCANLETKLWKYL